MDKNEFEKEYLGEFPPRTLLSWLEDFANQLDCPMPERNVDERIYLRRIGAWETQIHILKKLRFAIAAEKRLMK